MVGDRRETRVSEARIYPLGEEPPEDLTTITTAEERLQMVEILTLRLWELTGKSVPSYTRATMPGRVIRPQ